MPEGKDPDFFVEGCCPLKDDKFIKCLVNLCKLPYCDVKEMEKHHSDIRRMYC